VTLREAYPLHEAENQTRFELLVILRARLPASVHTTIVWTRGPAASFRLDEGASQVRLRPRRRTPAVCCCGRRKYDRRTSPERPDKAQ